MRSDRGWIRGAAGGWRSMPSAGGVAAVGLVARRSPVVARGFNAGQTALHLDPSASVLLIFGEHFAPYDKALFPPPPKLEARGSSPLISSAVGRGRFYWGFCAVWGLMPAVRFFLADGIFDLTHGAP